MKKNLFNDHRSSSKTFFNYIRKQTSVCSAIPCLKRDNGLALSDQDKANLLSKYFGSVFEEDNSVMPDFDVDCKSRVSSFSCTVNSVIKLQRS